MGLFGKSSEFSSEPMQVGAHLMSVEEWCAMYVLFHRTEKLQSFSVRLEDHSVPSFELALQYLMDRGYLNFYHFAKEDTPYIHIELCKMTQSIQQRIKTFITEHLNNTSDKATKSSLGVSYAPFI